MEKIRRKLQFSACLLLFRPLAATVQARKYFPVIFRDHLTLGNFFPKGIYRSVSSYLSTLYIATLVTEKYAVNSKNLFRNVDREELPF